MTFCRTVVIGYQYGKHSSNLPTKILILKTLAACKKKSNSLQEPHASLCHGNSRHSKCDKEMILRKMVPTKSVQMSTSLQSWLTCSSEQNGASEAFNFISRNIWGIDSELFQSNWMLYGLEGESSAILKHKEETSNKVCCSGLWVDPKLPFLTCSPDSLVGKDTVTKIKSLKIFKQYSVQAVTLLTSTILKEVLSKQCFCVKDGKCTLKCTHILLVTGRKFCGCISYSASGEDSVERIARDQPLIAKISEFLTTFWMRVVAPKIFGMRISGIFCLSFCHN